MRQKASFEPALHCAGRGVAGDENDQREDDARKRNRDIADPETEEGGIEIARNISRLDAPRYECGKHGDKENHHAGDAGSQDRELRERLAAQSGRKHHVPAERRGAGDALADELIDQHHEHESDAAKTADPDDLVDRETAERHVAGEDCGKDDEGRQPEHGTQDRKPVRRLVDARTENLLAFFLLAALTDPEARSNRDRRQQAEEPAGKHVARPRCVDSGADRVKDAAAGHEHCDDQDGAQDM